MNRQGIFSSCLGLLLLSFAGIGEAQEKSQRNLSTYTDGGSYELTWAASGPDELEKIKERVRTFIWEQWQRKRAAYISIRDCTEYPEGCADSTTLTFYIEPDKKGSWQLTEEAEHYVTADLNGGKEARERAYSVIFTNVEKVKPEEAETCFSIFSSKTEGKSYTFLLRFIYDKSKKDLSRNCMIF
ncbi:MAG: hypothetical protein QOF61_547 [Acidobacteriota bacterium]|jgi:guanyl-specific ribonuclease Sa|nr:hypothetical protein [Acidobacteriota bacterium]